MSIDTYVQLKTPISAEQVRAALLDDPALADLHLIDYPDDGEVAAKDVCFVARPWEQEDRHSIDNGFDTATVDCTVIPGRGDAGWEAKQRVIAAVLRLVPGDVCLASQDAAGPDLLRLGQVVYVNPEGFVPEHLAEFGYTAPHLVVGIPDKRW